MSVLTALSNRAHDAVRSFSSSVSDGLTDATERASSVVTAAVGRIDRRQFVRLLVAGVLGTIAVLPYQLSIVDGVEVPLPVVVVLAVVQTGVLVGLAAFVGLALQDQLGFSVRASSGPSPTVEREGVAVALGAFAAVAVVALDRFVFVPLLSAAAADSLALGAESPPLWAGLAASLYGGLTEEILLRFGFMTAVVWVIDQMRNNSVGPPSHGTIWAGIVLSAVGFGLGHLPATAAMVGINPTVVTRAVVLNGIPGIAFGYLYWKRDLVSAMCAHVCADVVLHVITPAVSP